MKRQTNIYEKTLFNSGKSFSKKELVKGGHSRMDTQGDFREPNLLKPQASETRHRLRTDVVKRFLHKDYTVKKDNHTLDYTIDICMYLCPISFQDMHKKYCTARISVVWRCCA